MKTIIHCPDIECDSCVAVISRALGRLQGVKAHEVRDARIEVEFDEVKLTKEQIVQAIRDKGYRASTEELARMGIAQRWRDFRTNTKKYSTERILLRYTGLALLAFLAFEVLVALLVEQVRPGFASSRGWWLFYLARSTATIAGALWHFKAYRGKVTCMTGMMIGMTQRA